MSFGKEIRTNNGNIYNTNKVISFLLHYWLDTSFSKESKYPKTLFEAREVAT